MCDFLIKSVSMVSETAIYLSRLRLHNASYDALIRGQPPSIDQLPRTLDPSSTSGTAASQPPPPVLAKAKAASARLVASAPHATRSWRAHMPCDSSVNYPFAIVSTRSDGLGSQLLDRIFALALAHKLGGLLPEWPKWPQRAGTTECFPDPGASNTSRPSSENGTHASAGCASLYNDALRTLVLPQQPQPRADGEHKYPGLNASARRCWPPR